ncbi:MAG: SAM-dependent methyltransferase, partial [Rhodobacteraceae bacterium]|nr:SAM-dependent methyltransferase [Paracoccaceae bacterium]
HGHAPTDPLEAPGLADLTAHVDFEALDRAARKVPGVAVSPPCEQGRWLERLGIAARAARLAERMRGEARAMHLAAYRRLTDPAEMGSLFKAIALTPAAAPPFPGLEPMPGTPGPRPPDPSSPEAHTARPDRP